MDIYIYILYTSTCIYIYIYTLGQGMNKCTGSNCFSFSRMLHVLSTIGHILRYALGVSRELSIIRGSCRNTSALTFPFELPRWLTTAEAFRGWVSSSHKSRSLQQVLDHLIHLLQVPSPQKRTRLDLATTRDTKVRWHPPTPQSPVSWLSGHDLVAISMGMGGWVFKKSSCGQKS